MSKVKAKKAKEQVEIKPLKEKKLRKRNTNKACYVDKKEMFAELVKYHTTDIISEELGEMFLKIARRFTNMYCFSSYTYRDELVNSAVHRMVEYIGKFDIKRPNPNPFCYFTQIAYNQILTVIKKEKQQSYIKSTCRDIIWDDLSQDEQLKYTKNIGDVDEFFSETPETDI